MFDIIATTEAPAFLNKEGMLLANRENRPKTINRRCNACFQTHAAPTRLSTHTHRPQRVVHQLESALEKNGYKRTTRT